MEGTLTSGKKWASGTGTGTGSIAFAYHSSSSTRSFPCITIQLDFTPSVIMVSGNNSASDTEYFSAFNNIGRLWGPVNVKIGSYKGSSLSTTTHNIKVDSKVNLGNNKYQIPLYGSSTSVSWVAYE